MTAEVLALDPALREDLDRAVEILKAAGCTEVYLFGSASSGRAAADSDLDLAVRGCPRGSFFEVLGELLWALKRPVDLLRLDTGEPFAAHLLSGGGMVRVG